MFSTRTQSCGWNRPSTVCFGKYFGQDWTESFLKSTVESSIISRKNARCRYHFHLNLLSQGEAIVKCQEVAKIRQLNKILHLWKQTTVSLAKLWRNWKRKIWLTEVLNKNRGYNFFVKISNENSLNATMFTMLKKLNMHHFLV